MSDFKVAQKSFCKKFDEFSLAKFNEYENTMPQAQLLLESMRYSFFSGGKRFRPFLSFLTAKAFNLDFNQVMPFAMAIEMIHTYSLIHDDLPCMDNDDFRRGVPTNHKKFGEDIALLSGDSLLTQAFSLLAKSYSENPQVAIALIQLLSDEAGLKGMITGQLLDMKSDSSINFEKLKLMHELKTGALIYASVVCVTHIFSFENDQKNKIDQFARLIGLAFQVKDDLLDANDKDQDYKNFCSLIGIEKTKTLLVSISNECKALIQSLKELNQKVLIDELMLLVDYNLNRES